MNSLLDTARRRWLTTAPWRCRIGYPRGSPAPKFLRLADFGDLLPVVDTVLAVVAGCNVAIAGGRLNW
jgi:hypothetical protein